MTKTDDRSPLHTLVRLAEEMEDDALAQGVGDAHAQELLYGYAQELRRRLVDIQALVPALVAALRSALAELDALQNVGRTAIDARPECDWNRMCAVDDQARAALALALALTENP